MNKIKDIIKNKISIHLYNIARQSLLNNVIGKIGDIVEEKDKITCYVNQRLLDKYGKNKNFIYTLSLNGMNTIYEESKKMIDRLKLNKPIYYIFENINFNTGLELSSHFSHVIFKNCTFDKNIGIFWADDITFENNKYLDNYPVYFYGKCFLYSTSIKKLTLINDNFLNSYKYPHPTKFGIDVCVDILEISNSTINIDYPASLNIKAKKAIIKNSKINANEFYLDAKSIDFLDSSITTKNGAIIENEDCDFSGQIDSPIIIYNGTELLQKKIDNNKKVDSQVLNLVLSRQLLIEKLHGLSDYCNDINNTKIQSVQDSLDKQSVAKTLKQR